MMLVVYALQYIDRVFDPHASLRIGYSTHAAFAIAATVFNAAFLPRLAVLWFGLLMLYLGLIAVEGYHGIGELLVTTAAVAPVCVAAAWTARRAERRSALRTVEGL